MGYNYKEETIKAYDNSAEIYAKKFKDLLELDRRSEFLEFLRLLKGNKILDLGCGAGEHSLYFKQKGLEVTAIDLSEQMIKLTKEKGINAIKMDIEDLKFSSDTFDGIWAVSSLIHVDKGRIADVVVKLRKILRKDGIMFVCLTEGKGEGLKIDETGKRFFSYWEKESALKEFQDDFEILTFERVEARGRVFLQMFLKKR